MTLRLFIAIPIPENIKRQILAGIKLPGFYRNTKPEIIHITLFFFGDVIEERVNVIKESLDEVLINQNSFKLGIDSTGQFPEKGMPRIIYVTGDSGKNELQGLFDKIKNRLNTAGFSGDKEFKYHITVARLNERADIDRSFKSPVFNGRLSFDAKNVILYKSDLQKNGPVYTPVYEWKFLK